MRYQLMIIGLLTTMTIYPELAHSQRKIRLPFQVLHAENAYIDDFGTPLKQFSLLEKEQELYLKDGYVILVDYYGKFYELEKVEKIGLMNLFNDLDSEEFPSTIPRIDIKPLFLTQGRFFTEDIRAYLCHRPSIEFDFIGEEGFIKVLENKPVQLSWSVDERLETSGKYRIMIKNIFDEVIGSFDTDTTYIELKLDKIENESILYIITAFDRYVENLSSIELAIEQNNESANYSSSFFAEPQNAAEALQAGFELEKLGNRKLAESFYEMATVLSERAIYQKLLASFRERAYEKD